MNHPSLSDFQKRIAFLTAQKAAVCQRLTQLEDEKQQEERRFERFSKQAEQKRRSQLEACEQQLARLHKPALNLEEARSLGSDPELEKRVKELKGPFWLQILEAVTGQSSTKMAKIRQVRVSALNEWQHQKRLLEREIQQIHIIRYSDDMKACVSSLSRLSGECKRVAQQLASFDAELQELQPLYQELLQKEEDAQALMEEEEAARRMILKDQMAEQQLRKEAAQLMRDRAAKLQSLPLPSYPPAKRKKS